MVHNVGTSKARGWWRLGGEREGGRERGGRGGGGRDRKKERQSLLIIKYYCFTSAERVHIFLSEISMHSLPIRSLSTPLTTKETRVGSVTQSFLLRYWPRSERERKERKLKSRRS